MDCNRFAVALIDGDSMPFLDSFVIRGFEGGVEAGRQFRQALTDYHQMDPLHRGDDKIIIYITANLHGLSQAYTHAGITNDSARVYDFYVGVGQSHPLTSVVDAGRQKEAADSKVRAQMELYYSNTHCQRIIFGGSDSGYAPFLDTFAKPEHVNKRVSILKPSHMPGAMHRTLSQFLTVDLAEIFRASKIVTSRPGPDARSPVGVKRPASDSIVPPVRKPPTPIYHGLASHAQKMTLDHAEQKADPQSQYRPENPFVMEEVPPRQVYFVNQYGQRLDQSLQYDQQYLRFLFTKKARLCNNHYLRGYCQYGMGCTWDHSEDLTPLQLDTLRHKARTSACRDPYCTDVYCTLGHICPRSAADCAMEACKFVPAQHDVPCSQVFEVDAATGERRQVSVQLPTTLSRD